MKLIYKILLILILLIAISAAFLLFNEPKSGGGCTHDSFIGTCTITSFDGGYVYFTFFTTETIHSKWWNPSPDGIYGIYYDPENMGLNCTNENCSYLVNTSHTCFLWIATSGTCTPDGFYFGSTFPNGER